MQKFITAIGVTLVLLSLPTVTVYNDIFTHRQTTRDKWVRVEYQMQKRSGLIPKLAGYVKECGAGETALFKEVAKARSQWAKAQSVEEKIMAACALDATVSRLKLGAEKCPGLKENPEFARLTDELAVTRKRIAAERTRYNDAAKDYNDLLRTFPANIVAIIFGFAAAAEYADPAERAKKETGAKS
ncbi:MAG: LemA family protein [Candidatus Omnitrophica bacterium]|nr:LemA family protein [Candidatus Omnitrophota bacterium]